MENLVLTDPGQYPEETIIYSHIGQKQSLWMKLFTYIREQLALSEEWKYYRDGKSWLLKLRHKKKTVCWVSVFAGGFRVTFYFTDKAVPALQASPIKEERITKFLGGKKFGKIRALTISPENESDLRDINTLVDFKLNLK